MDSVFNTDFGVFCTPPVLDASEDLGESARTGEALDFGLGLFVSDSVPVTSMPRGVSPKIIHSHLEPLSGYVERMQKLDWHMVQDLMISKIN